MKIKVLGAGCSTCKTLLIHTQEAVKESGIPIEVEYVTDLKEVMKYRVMNLPGLVINEKVISAGKVLSKEEVVSKIMTVLAEDEISS